jgi:hypothetical protein
LKLSPMVRTWGDRVALHAQVQIPVEVEIVVEVVPHERLAGKPRVHELVEESDDLVAVHWPVKVRGDRRHVDPFAEVVVAALLEPLQEHGDAFFGSGRPAFVDQPPEVGRQRVLLREGDVDHRQRRPLALVDAAQEEGDDRVLDIRAVEVAGDRGAEAGQRGREIVGRSGRRHPLGRKPHRGGRGARQQSSAFHPDALPGLVEGRIGWIRLGR